jgi:hypothetical protein
VVGVAALFTLARFSEAFLVLKARAAALPMTFVPVVMVVMRLVYALTTYPAGVISDRAGRWPLLVLGPGALIVADSAPVEPRGSAFGLFNLATGVALLVASALAGALFTALAMSGLLALSGRRSLLG